MKKKLLFLEDIDNFRKGDLYQIIKQDDQAITISKTENRIINGQLVRDECIDLINNDILQILLDNKLATIDEVEFNKLYFAKTKPNAIIPTKREKDITKEIWMPVVGYEDLYEVSSLGNVKSLGRVVEYSDGRIRHCQGKIMSQCISAKKNTKNMGYKQVRLTDYNKKSTAHFVHRLVAEAFISNPENKYTVNHIDGNKHNNNVDNLEWASYSENNQHAYDNNLKSDNRPIFMLDYNNNILKQFNSIHEASRYVHGNYRNIHSVCCGKRITASGYKWKYIEDVEVPKNQLIFAKVKQNAIIPTKRDEDCAYDIYTCETETIVIKPCSLRMIDTGIAIACNKVYFPKFFDKGGMGSKGIIVGAGVGDSGYRDSYFIPLINTNKDKTVIITTQSDEDIEGCTHFDLQQNKFITLDFNRDVEASHYVKKENCIIKPISKAITQFVMLPVPTFNIKELSWDELKNIKSERGLGKLGSSGK